MLAAATTDVPYVSYPIKTYLVTFTGVSLHARFVSDSKFLVCVCVCVCVCGYTGYWCSFAGGKQDENARGVWWLVWGHRPSYDNCNGSLCCDGILWLSQVRQSSSRQYYIEPSLS